MAILLFTDCFLAAERIIDIEQRNAPSCPSGKTYYSCQNNDNISGCCSSDPCGSGGSQGSNCTVPSGVEFVMGGTPPLSAFSSSASSTTTTLPASNTQSTITHTIPNTHVVTITEHTTINLPSPTSSPSIPSSPLTTALHLTLTSTPAPANATSTVHHTGITGTASARHSNNNLSTGAIAGVGVGGAMALALVAMLAIFAWRRRVKHGGSHESAEQEYHHAARDDHYDEKHFPHPMSAHTTGTQEDPFAPFGGRADHADSFAQVQDGMAEMDAANGAPVELPAVSVEPARAADKAGASSQPAPRSQCDFLPNSEADPRSNLRHLQTDSGQPAYVNHWNQYRSLGVD